MGYPDRSLVALLFRGYDKRRHQGWFAERGGVIASGHMTVHNAVHNAVDKAVDNFVDIDAVEGVSSRSTEGEGGPLNGNPAHP